VSCPAGSAKIDNAFSRLGDDADRWFLVAMVADPWVLEYRANVVFHLGTHFLISALRIDRPTLFYPQGYP
jgi:hypothetical protein